MHRTHPLTSIVRYFKGCLIAKRFLFSIYVAPHTYICVGICKASRASKVQETTEPDLIDILWGITSDSWLIKLRESLKGVRALILI